MHHYYSLLGLPPTATLEEIKRAYRSLAKQLHPDLNPGDPYAVARFQELGRAYEMLVAEKNRPTYGTPPYGAPPYGYPPAYGQYPPGYGYQPPPPPTNQATGYSNYAWQEWNQWEDLSADLPPEEPAPPPPQAEPFTPPPVEPEPEPVHNPLRQDLVEAAFEEACRMARVRAQGEPKDKATQLDIDVRRYLIQRDKEKAQAREKRQATGRFAGKGGMGFRLDPKKFWR